MAYLKTKDQEILLESDTIVKAIGKANQTSLITVFGSLVVGEKVQAQMKEMEDSSIEMQWVEQFSRKIVAKGQSFVPPKPGNYICQAKVFSDEGVLAKIYETPF